jgi:hypothetical protein
MLSRQGWIGFAAAAVVAAVYSVPTLANVQTWSFNSATQSFSNTSNGNTLSLTSSDGINLTVTGWSDTDDITGDDTIETAKLIWAQSAALGIQNQDEDTNSPNHSIDSDTTDSDGEFDMLLLEFDTAVNLNGIDLAWAVGGNASDKADVSILAWDGAGSDVLSGETWASVLDTNGGGYDSIGNYSNVGLSYYTVNTSNVESTKWLVGVYNPVYGAGGDAGDDGIKLASITTSTPNEEEPPGEVPVPGTLALMLAGLAALRTRRVPSPL